MNCWSYEVHQWMSRLSLRWPWNERIHAQLTEWLMNQGFNEGMNQWSNESTNPQIKELVNQRINEPMKQWFNNEMNQWDSEPTTQCVNESLDQWTKEPMNFANLILQKCSDPLNYFSCDFEVQIEFSHFASFIFSAPIHQFFRAFGVQSKFFEMQIKLWLARILPTSSSKKWSEHAQFEHFEVQFELSLQSCALCVGNFPRSRSATATPGATLLEKNTHSFAPESVFTCEFTRSRTVYNTSQLLDDDVVEHDDVFDMMMGLTWCGWHDGVNANHDHRPQLGRFLTKLPLTNQSGYNFA